LRPYLVGMRNLLTKHGSRSRRGQSLVEFALILPFLLAFAGAGTDLARAYQAWLTLESAARNAAEYAATSSVDASGAQTDAQRIVCLESQRLPGFIAGTGVNPTQTCSAPSVTATFTTSSTDLGASPKNPIGTAVVHVSLPFKTLIPYPFLPNGVMTLSADRTYSVVRGR
jgi:Flp pilus assembly protein TadG